MVSGVGLHVGLVVCEAAGLKAATVLALQRLGKEMWAVTAVYQLVHHPCRLCPFLNCTQVLGTKYLKIDFSGLGLVGLVVLGVCRVESSCPLGAPEARYGDRSCSGYAPFSGHVLTYGGVYPLELFLTNEYELTDSDI